MATDKFLTYDQATGQPRSVTATKTSAGVANANQIVALGSDGLLSSTVMPAGIGAPSISKTASEILAAGDFVNFHGTNQVRKADRTLARPAHGFVTAGVANAATATVFLSGQNTALSSLTANSRYYLGATGTASLTPPANTDTGHIYQFLGTSVSATSLNFEENDTIVMG